MRALTIPFSSRRPGAWPSGGSAAGLLALALAAPLSVQAQTPAPAAVAPAESEALARGERIERITHEDKLSRIDELRVGGQTRSISVQPKNGAPGYEIAPAVGAEPAETQGAGNAGKSRWRILNF